MKVEIKITNDDGSIEEHPIEHFFPSNKDIYTISKIEVKSKSDLPFFHKENVNIDLCRVMWVNGVHWLIEKLKLQSRNNIFVANKINWDDLKDGDIYEQEQDKGEWVKGKICHHWRGNLMIELLEGRLKGKRWYLFPDLKSLRRVVA